MEEQLKAGLEAILEEKNTKLLPENIKAGVTVLGVTGELTESPSNASNVRQFNSIEEMNASTGNQEGDLAVVYTTGFKPMKADSVIKSVWFPQTVVLDTGIISNITFTFVPENSNDYIYGECYINKSNFYITYGTPSQTSMVSMHYWSRDGVTYYRNTEPDNPEHIRLEFYIPMHIAEASTWDDALGKFIQIYASTFDGLFAYEENEYKVAPNQFTATNSSLLPHIIGYGKEGVVIGDETTYDNLDVKYMNVSEMFDDFAAVAYTKAKFAYNDMTPVIVDDDTSVEFFSSLITIPTNKNGEPLLDTSSVTMMTNAFANRRDIQYLDLSNLNTSSVSQMSGMFSSCANLKHLDISNLNTENVTDMSSMFSGCNNLIAVDVSSFDTSSVERMGSMFWGCTALRQLDLSNFNTSSVTDVGMMFRHCGALETLTLSSNFTTVNITAMNQLFYDCASLTELDLSSFDTSNVTTMNNMFGNCKSLTELDLSNFNTSNVVNMGSMFDGCTSLTKLDISSFDFTKVTTKYSVFSGVPANCLIYVKDQTAKDWVLSVRNNLTNVQIKPAT